MRPMHMRLFAAAVAMTLVSCGNTQLRTTWKDPTFSGGPVRQVLVIGVAKSDVYRRVFEDGFSQALQDAGTRAEPSYRILPEAGPLSNARIMDAVAQTGADGVIVTRVLRVERRVDVTPGWVAPGYHPGGFYGWYGTAWVPVPPDVNAYEVLTIESTLWNMRLDKPVWSGTIEASEPKDVAELTSNLAKLLIERMKSDRVL